MLSRFFPFLIAGSYRGIRNVKYVKRDGKLYTYFNYFLLGPQYSSSNMKKMERIWKCRVSWIYHFNICQNESMNLDVVTIYDYKSRLHEMFWTHCEWKMHGYLDKRWKWTSLKMLWGINAKFEKKPTIHNSQGPCFHKLTADVSSG